MMIPAPHIAMLYGMFTFACAMPWFGQWAMHGRWPVMTRLLSSFVFFSILGFCLCEFWLVHRDYPEHMRDARNLLAPMVAICIVGFVISWRSLFLIYRESKVGHDTNAG